MSSDRITVDEFKYMSVFSEITGATPVRCVIDNENSRLLFLVGKGELGKAVGRGGRNIKILSDLFRKPVEVYEFSEDLHEMIKNLFVGVNILEINVTVRNEEKIVSIRVKEEDKGKAIGKNGRNVRRANIILGKLFGVSRVIIR
ncbi:MAG: NusA-like transcription termination signal-binding factor [Acidilobaceae archaeon]